MDRHVYAKRKMTYLGKTYRPGDELPPVDAKQLAKWQQADSVHVLGAPVKAEQPIKLPAPQGKERAEKHAESP